MISLGNMGAASKVAFDFEERKIYSLNHNGGCSDPILEYCVYSLEGVLLTSEKIDGLWPERLILLDPGSVFFETGLYGKYTSHFRGVPSTNFPRRWEKAHSYLFTESEDQITAWSLRGKRINSITKPKNAELMIYEDRAIVEHNGDISLLEVEGNRLQATLIFEKYEKESVRCIDTKVLTIGRYSVFIQHHIYQDSGESYIYFKEQGEEPFVGWSSKTCCPDNFWVDGNELFLEYRDLDYVKRGLLYNWKERRSVFEVGLGERMQLKDLFFSATSIVVGYGSYYKSDIVVLSRRSGRILKSCQFGHSLKEMAIFRNKIYAHIGNELRIIDC